MPKESKVTCIAAVVSFGRRLVGLECGFSPKRTHTLGASLLVLAFLSQLGARVIIFAEETCALCLLLDLLGSLRWLCPETLGVKSIGSRFLCRVKEHSGKVSAADIEMQIFILIILLDQNLKTSG